MLTTAPTAIDSKFYYAITTDNGRNMCSVSVVQKNCFEPLSLELPLSLSIDTDKITSLVLSNCNLLHIPTELLFVNLFELNVSCNKICMLPERLIYETRKLQILNLSHNAIKSLDTTPECITELRILNLSYNKLNTVPFWLFTGSCAALEVLNLNNNPIDWTQALHPSGHRLKNLHTLHLDNCCISLYYVKFISEIRSLRILSIGNVFSLNFLNWNNIQETPFALFASVNSLVELNLSGLGFSVLADAICELSALRKLNVSNNHLSWFPDNFSKLKSLQVLDFSYNEVICLPSDISECADLTELNLAYNAVGSLPSSLTLLDKLTHVDCYQNDLLFDVLSIVEKLPSLIAIDLERNLFITDNISWYTEKKERMRNIRRDSRCDGIKEIKEDDSVSYYGSEKSNDSEPELYLNGNDNYVEENWENEDVYVDDYLILPTFKSATCVQKQIHSNPSDFIDPEYFEDAPGDET